MDLQASWMSMVDRKVWAPVDRIHSWTLSLPHWQAASRMSLPLLLRARFILR